MFEFLQGFGQAPPWLCLHLASTSQEMSAPPSCAHRPRKVPKAATLFRPTQNYSIRTSVSDSLDKDGALADSPEHAFIGSEILAYSIIKTDERFPYSISDNFLNFILFPWTIKKKNE